MWGTRNRGKRRGSGKPVENTARESVACGNGVWVARALPLGRSDATRLFRFLCRDCKNRRQLDHNLSNYVHHRHGLCEDSVYLKLVEEMFDAIKDANYLILASARIISRLGVPSVNWSKTGWNARKDMLKQKYSMTKYPNTH